MEKISPGTALERSKGSRACDRSSIVSVLADETRRNTQRAQALVETGHELDESGQGNTGARASNRKHSRGLAEPQSVARFLHTMGGAPPASAGPSRQRSQTGMDHQHRDPHDQLRALYRSLLERQSNF